MCDSGPVGTVSTEAQNVPQEVNNVGRHSLSADKALPVTIE